MGDNVDFIPLRNLSVRITKGTTPTRGESFVSRGINYVKSEAIAPSGTIDSSKFAYIDEATHNALARSQLCVGNVLFSMAGVYLGKTAVVKPEHVPANTNQAVGIITIDEAKADSRFIHYSIQSPSCRAWIMNSAAQSAQPNFNLKEIGDLPIPSFELEEQRAIAHILGTLDDKIELNRRRNQTLEAMARALFKDWFVDFGPVRAKMEGREPYLPADLWRLFPNRLDDEGKPEGWTIAALDTLAALVTTSISPGKSPETVFEHYSIPAYDAGRMPAMELGASIKSNKYVVDADAVLVSKLNPQTPRIWLPAIATAHAICSTEFMQFVPHDPRNRPYLYCLMSSEAMQNEVLRHVTGSTGSRQRAQPSQIAKVDFLQPHEDILAAFNHQAAPILNAVADNQRESHTLAQLRDTLLPKLISGELRIADVEKFLEGVGL
jgi:type I restriction enzyme, S subunit